MIGDCKGKRHQVTIYLPSTTLDAYGQRTGADTEVLADVPAKIEQLDALELIRARKIFPEATHSVDVTLYPGHGINSRHYLKWGTRRLDIGGAVDVDGTEHEVRLLCKEAL